MTVTYGVIKETHLLKGHVRHSYGIAAYANARENGTLTLLAAAHDITSDRRSAEHLAEKCNKTRLSLYHFESIIEDFLAEQKARI